MTIRVLGSRDKITKNKNLCSFTNESAEILPNSSVEYMNLRQLF